MKRFTFRLQRILDIREQIRDEARQELGRRNAVLAQERSMLEGLEAELQRLNAPGDGIVTAGELLLTGTYALRVQKMIEQQVIKVEEARKAVVEAQEKYFQANRDARALEMLKEKKRAEYNQQVLKEEINQLDEVAMQRAGREKRGSEGI
ncbi:MAG: Flagellar FliJ protein [Pseudomonadota bacterium]|jgi:flagellar FliJ protein